MIVNFNLNIFDDNVKERKCILKNHVMHIKKRLYLKNHSNWYERILAINYLKNASL